MVKRLQTDFGVERYLIDDQEWVKQNLLDVQYLTLN